MSSSKSTAGNRGVGQQRIRRVLCVCLILGLSACTSLDGGYDTGDQVHATRPAGEVPVVALADHPASNTLIADVSGFKSPVSRLDKSPQRILFVGNSFTYYNDSLHNHLRKLIRAGKPTIDTSFRIRIMTISGAPLPEHAAAMPGMVASESWDVVVMQGHSLGPINPKTKEPFRNAARSYARLIRDQGAEPVFFMTWAYTGKPEMTAPLANEYVDIASELDALVVPVGLAFEYATNNHPEIVLRHADKKHPTLAGTYLAACMFYASLYGQSPVGLDYESALESRTARALQETAWQVAQRFF